MKKGLIIHIEKCLACKSCEIACAIAHSQSKTLESAINESPRPVSRVTVEAAEEFSIPMQCRHCEDAPCIAVCPTTAIHRHNDDSPVLIDKEKCIGCKYCLMACPFGVIDMTGDGKAVVKCDLCIERTSAGEEPACVAGCPTGALEFGDISEQVRKRRKAAAKEARAAVNNAAEEATE